MLALISFTGDEMKAAAAGALTGGLLALYHDMNAYITAPAGAAWDWSKTFARVGVGALGGALAAIGIVAAVS